MSSFWNVANIFWAVGFAATSICLIIALPLFFSIIRSLKSDDILLPSTKTTAILSSVLNMLCIMFYFVSFPICMVRICGDNVWGYVTFLSITNTYILSKIFLYSLFIARVYSQFFKKLYPYSNKLLYCLRFMMFLALVTVILVNISYWYHFPAFMKYVDDTTAGGIVLVFLDFGLSVFTLLLFVIPSCSVYGHAMKLKIMKLIVLSSIAILSSTFCGVGMVVRYYFHWYWVYDITFHIAYVDVLNTCKCMDCVMSLTCIYFGFVSKGMGLYTKHCGKFNLCLVRLTRFNDTKESLKNPLTRERECHSYDLYKPLIMQNDESGTFMIETTTTGTTTESSSGTVPSKPLKLKRIETSHFDAHPSLSYVRIK
eukprot:36414_1